MSDDFLPRAMEDPDSALMPVPGSNSRQYQRPPDGASSCLGRPRRTPHPPRGAFAGFPQTPFPSQVMVAAEADISEPEQCQWAWAYPSYTSSYEQGYSHSMPSCVPHDKHPGLSGEPDSLEIKSHSLPSRPLEGRRSPSAASLEQPSSLHSIPPLASPHTYPHHPYGYHPLAPPCCTHCPPPGYHHMGPMHQLSPWPGHRLPHKHSGLNPSEHGRTSTTKSELGAAQAKHTSPRQTHLSMEQRKVFVTYEEDSEDHVNEIIKFVALLRHNGFDTHIDVFEQQLNSISKIDCTEKYIQEKDYLIIIAISPKYYEVVAGDSMFVERDERTLNTVYIHKQLQNEFIQNGCKNFRFIPILFPGAKKSHVPSWLRNTHVYSWPKHRDDVLRRLMRVEKYNPPPVGELPTIVSIPI